MTGPELGRTRLAGADIVRGACRNSATEQAAELNQIQVVTRRTP
jgi:hypothetical protein